MSDEIKVIFMSNNKQFSLDTKEHCIYYLWRIISSCELCMDSFKDFNKETEEILQKYKKKDKIPYYIYTSMSNKTSNVMCYLLNLLGDCQTTSISYFKYRKQAQKLINRGNTDIKIIPISEDSLVNKLLIEFNKQRNWLNHVPESILLSELELLKQGKIRLNLDPVKIFHYNYVSYEWFEDLYNGNKHFYENARIIIQAAKKDYSLLQDKTIEYPREYIDIPVTPKNAEAVQMSAKIQGIFNI